MTIDELMEMWERDGKIDDEKIGRETLRTAHLHGKYLNYMIRVKTDLRNANYTYLQMREIRWRYFQKQTTMEELEQYGWEPFRRMSPMKSGMAEVLDADSFLHPYRKKVDALKTAEYVLESILKQILARDWQIKNYIEWEKISTGR